MSPGNVIIPTMQYMVYVKYGEGIPGQYNKILNGLYTGKYE
jgi:hypothetical protein